MISLSKTKVTNHVEEEEGEAVPGAAEHHEEEDVDRLHREALVADRQTDGSVEEAVCEEVVFRSGDREDMGETMSGYVKMACFILYGLYTLVGYISILPFIGDK